MHVYVTRSRGRRRLMITSALAVGALVAVGSWASRALHGDASAASRQLDPRAFSSGACVALSPTAGNRHTTVFLDAGHGGIDPGAVGQTAAGTPITEAADTLPVELDAARLLRAQGYRVVVSRTSDTSVVRLSSADVSGGELSLQGAHDDVAARDVCANLAHAGVLVGIYFDAGPTAVSAGSLTTYDSARAFASENYRLATLLQANVLAAMNARGWGIPNAGVTSDALEGSAVPTTSTGTLAQDAASYGHVLLLGPAMPGYFDTPSNMPGALIEPLFITDPAEGSIAASTSGQEAIAHGLDAAIEQYFGASVGSG